MLCAVYWYIQRKAWLGSPSARPPPTSRMSLWPTKCTWEKAPVDLCIAKLIATYPVAEDQLLLLMVLLGHGSVMRLFPLAMRNRVWPASILQLGQPAALLWAEWVWWPNCLAEIKPMTAAMERDRAAVSTTPSPSFCPCSWPWGLTFSAAVLPAKQTVNIFKKLLWQEGHFLIQSDLCFKLRFSGKTLGLVFT